MPKLTSHSKAATYQTYVWKQLKRLGIGAEPDRQTIFVLYIPCKPPQALDSFGCVSHHPAIVPTASEPQFTNLDSMAVVLGDPSRLDRLEDAGREPRAGRGGHGHGRRLVHPRRCRPARGGARSSSPRPSVSTTYSYVRIYANRRSSEGGDPAVPSNPHPYYNVTSAQDWPKVTAGGAAKSVVLTGWSAKKIPAWKVTATVLSWEGGKAGTGADPCTIAGKTSWSVANGGTLTLKVKAKPGSKGKWCDVLLKSAAAPTSDSDASHPGTSAFTSSRW